MSRPSAPRQASAPTLSAFSAEIRALATANCAVDWGWTDPEGITCYCIIPGQPGILHFEDLGDN